MYDNLVDALFTDLDCTEPLTRKFIEGVLQDVKLFDRKQHDYGSENISAFGETGVLVRANDKMARLRNLYRNGKTPLAEVLDDSWADLSIYGGIARMVRAGVWPGVPALTPPPPPPVPPPPSLVGRRVQVIHSDTPEIPVGSGGVVVRVSPDSSRYHYLVNFDDRYYWWFYDIPGITDGVEVALVD